MVRSSHDSARSRLRAKLARFSHKVDLLGGTNANGQDDNRAWERRHAAMLEWANGKFGANGYTTASGRIERREGFRDVVSFHFETAEHLRQFCAVFILKRD